MTLSIKFSVMTLGIMTLSIMTLGIMKLCIMTYGIMALSMTVKSDIQHNFIKIINCKDSMTISTMTLRIKTLCITKMLYSALHH